MEENRKSSVQVDRATPFKYNHGLKQESTQQLLTQSQQNGLESDWRLGKYFDTMTCENERSEMNEFHELESYISNCSDSDIDDSASVAYAFNYLKEYVHHMKSAKMAKENLINIFPNNSGSASNLQKCGRSNSEMQAEAPQYASNFGQYGSMSRMPGDGYDHLISKSNTLAYTSMHAIKERQPQNQQQTFPQNYHQQQKYDFEQHNRSPPQTTQTVYDYNHYYKNNNNNWHLPQENAEKEIIRRTVSEGRQNLVKLGEEFKLPHKPVQREYTHSINTKTQQSPKTNTNPINNYSPQVIEVCSPSETSVSSKSKSKQKKKGLKAKFFYESLDKLNFKSGKDQVEQEKRSKTSPENRDNAEKCKKKSKKPEKEKIYLTTSSVLYQPIAHSKECLESLDLDEVKPCNCLKTVAANQHRYNPSKQAHVMESIYDDEISDFNSNSQKKKLNRTVANNLQSSSETIPHREFSGEEQAKEISHNNTLRSKFSHYDKVSHPIGRRSMTVFRYSNNSQDSLNYEKQRANSLNFNDSPNCNSINEIAMWPPQGYRKTNRPLQYSKVIPAEFRMKENFNEKAARVHSLDNSRIVKRKNSMEKIEILEDFKSTSTSSRDSRAGSISPLKNSPNQNGELESNSYLPSYPNLPTFNDSQRFDEHPNSEIIRAASNKRQVSEL